MLGIGTFKKIYKGYDYNLGREVAWCEINREQGNTQNISLIIKNIENIIKLKHPNLLDYIAVYYKEDTNKVIIITELLQGGNLKEYRKYQKKLKVKLVKKWLRQILSALDFLHSNNLIHHDIKSKNILVDRISGDLKLGDLIFAEKLGQNGFYSKYVGKEEYMAPEVKEGKYTFKADIYSLGLTIVQFITMEKPYKEYSRKKELYEAKKNGIYPLVFNNIKNEDIKNFIALCLQEEKSRPSCKELLNNKWLNDKDSLDNNTFIELSNDNINSDKSKSCLDKNPNNYKYKYKSSFNRSNDTLLINESISSSIQLRPIYSLDISKLNSSDCPYANKNNKSKIIHYDSFINCKQFLKKDSNKKIKSLFSINIGNKNNESKSIFSDKESNKYLNEFISDENIFEIDLNKIITELFDIYLYIIENKGKFYFIFKENEEDIDGINILLCVKITTKINNKKNMKIKNEKKIELIGKNEKEYLDIIIEQLKCLIELNKKDISLIRQELNEKINSTIKTYKIIILKEKINKIIKNLKDLTNNNNFNYLDCIINNENINIAKLPKEINDKLKNYKEKKTNILNIFCLNNVNSNDEFYNGKTKEILLINLS